MSERNLRMRLGLIAIVVLACCVVEPLQPALANNALILGMVLLLAVAISPQTMAPLRPRALRRSWRQARRRRG